jgi:diguanylate cyclase (GGDEF)-like protein
VHAELAAHGFTVVAGMSERMVVMDTHQIAGTFDLILERNGVQYIADIKTGSSTDRIGYATQLACYSLASHYWTEGGWQPLDLTDALTGVFNRRGLMAAVEKAQADAISTGRPLALAVVDIDHFKRFNDRFGHAMGDDVLRFVASHLAERLETDGGFVGRLGGEEFVGVMPATSVQAAAGRIDRIRADLAGQVLRSAVDGSSMGRISFSAGVAEHRDGQGPDQLIERADGALYTAKRLGRDRVVPDRG